MAARRDAARYTRFPRCRASQRSVSVLLLAPSPSIPPSACQFLNGKSADQATPGRSSTTSPPPAALALCGPMGGGRRPLRDRRHGKPDATRPLHSGRQKLKPSCRTSFAKRDPLIVSFVGPADACYERHVRADIRMSMKNGTKALWIHMHSQLRQGHYHLRPPRLHSP